MIGKWVLCCDCGNMAKCVDTGVWVDTPEIVDRLKAVRVSHGYCPECLGRAMALAENACSGLTGGGCVV